MVEHTLQRDDIIVVEWQDGKYCKTASRSSTEHNRAQACGYRARYGGQNKNGEVIWNAVFVSKLPQLNGELDDEVKAPAKPPRTKKKAEVK